MKYNTKINLQLLRKWRGVSLPKQRCARAALHWVTALALTAGLSMTKVAADEPLAVQEIAAGIFVAFGAQEDTSLENLGAIANVGFIVGDDAVAVIDTGGSAAHGRRLLASVRAVTSLPIRYLINTHVHPDHLLGNAAFADPGVDIVGHHKLPRSLAARGSFYMDGLKRVLGNAAAGTEIIAPTLTVSDELELDLGNRKLVLTAHPTAHTDSDLSVFDVMTKTLWLSDLLFVERTPVLDGSINGWIAALEQFRDKDVAHVVPGHGPVAVDIAAALAPQERYLRLLRDEIRGLLAGGGTLQAAMETVGQSERNNWLLFDDYNPRNVATAFTELEWE